MPIEKFSLNLSTSYPYRGMPIPSANSLASSPNKISSPDIIIVPSKYKQIPEYLSYGCEMKVIVTKSSTEVKWDLGINKPTVDQQFPSLVLDGEKGISKVLFSSSTLSSTTSIISLNENCGFYVNIGLIKQNYYLEDLKKICHNFLKYEFCFDQIMHESRTNNPDCLSNRLLFPDDNIEIERLIYECNSVKDLQEVMCQNKANFKLNLMNVDKNGTIEFRQHKITFISEEIESWLRFVIWFVSNSIMQKRSFAFSSERDQEFEFRSLFKYLIRDNYIKEYYENLRFSKNK
jgi:hypothetical protein